MRGKTEVAMMGAIKAQQTRSLTEGVSEG